MPAVARRNKGVSGSRDGGIRERACWISGSRYPATPSGESPNVDKPGWGTLVNTYSVPFSLWDKQGWMEEVGKLGRTRLNLRYPIFACFYAFLHLG